MQTATENPSPRNATDAERFMLDVIKRFHRSRCYTLHALRRTERDGQRVFLSVTEFRPQRRGARPEWNMVEWNADEMSIRFLRQRNRVTAMRELKAYGPIEGTSSCSSDPMSNCQRALAANPP